MKNIFGKYGILSPVFIIIKADIVPMGSIPEIILGISEMNIPSLESKSRLVPFPEPVLSWDGKPAKNLCWFLYFGIWLLLFCFFFFCLFSFCLGTVQGLFHTKG